MPTSAAKRMRRMRARRKFLGSLTASIIRPPIASDPAREVPRSSWGDLMSERHKFCTKYLPRDCRNLLFFVEDGAANQWLGFGSRERYIAEGLGLDPQMVEWALAGLRRMRPEQADSLDEMVVLGKQGRLSDAPRDAKGRFLSGSPKGDNIIFGQRGTSSGYTLARLDRDGHTDLAAKVRSREISAHAAAIEAGFRRPTVTITDDVPRAAATIVRRWGPEHARRLAEAIFEKARS